MNLIHLTLHFVRIKYSLLDWFGEKHLATNQMELEKN